MGRKAFNRKAGIAMKGNLSKMYTAKTPLGEASRALAKGWREDKCNCGRFSLDPAHHEYDCGYRRFFRDSMKGKP